MNTTTTAPTFFQTIDAYVEDSKAMYPNVSRNAIKTGEFIAEYGTKSAIVTTAAADGLRAGFSVGFGKARAELAAARALRLAIK